jgi:diacylglycerol kinase (ATP)
MPPKITGFKRFYYASVYSWQGVRAAYCNEPAFRYEAWAGAVLIPASFWVAATPLQWAALMAVYLLILTMELLNTAIEAVVDRAGMEYNPMAGLAKDLGSAAVTVTILICTLVWGATFIQNLG